MAIHDDLPLFSDDFGGGVFFFSSTELLTLALFLLLSVLFGAGPLVSKFSFSLPVPELEPSHSESVLGNRGDKQ